MRSMENKHKPYGLYEKYFKRLLDILCGLAAVIVFCWLYIVLIILGKNEKIFKLIKFRTMDNRKDKNGNLLPDEVRLNKYGRFLRGASLDELPEAFNIIKGDMSVIGPRPLLVSYLPYYTEAEHHRHDVRPGLSGWAQVNGRTICGWDKKLSYDLEYVNNISFLFDLKVILKSVQVFFHHSDNAVDTSKTEGNFAEIRKAMMEANRE